VEYQRTRFGYVLRLDRGEEILESLARFATEQGVRSGWISGLGSVTDPELGYFLRDSKSYEKRRMNGEFEIGALTGNFTEIEGKPFLHCHVVLGDRTFAATAGHLFHGTVSVTCEVSVVTDPTALRRVRRDDLGFHPIEIKR
jgi:predicted DNA-binding protein with PD1-like motif